MPAALAGSRATARAPRSRQHVRWKAALTGSGASNNRQPAVPEVPGSNSTFWLNSGQFRPVNPNFRAAAAASRRCQAAAGTGLRQWHRRYRRYRWCHQDQCKLPASGSALVASVAPTVALAVSVIASSQATMTQGGKWDRDEAAQAVPAPVASNHKKGDSRCGRWCRDDHHKPTAVRPGQQHHQQCRRRNAGPGRPPAPVVQWCRWRCGSAVRWRGQRCRRRCDQWCSRWRHGGVNGGVGGSGGEGGIEAWSASYAGGGTGLGGSAGVASLNLTSTAVAAKAPRAYRLVTRMAPTREVLVVLEPGSAALVATVAVPDYRRSGYDGGSGGVADRVCRGWQGAA